MKKPPPRKKKEKPTGPRRLAGELLDVAALSALLGTTEKTVRSRASRQLLPHRKWAGRVVFLRGEVMEFLAKLDGCDVGQALANVAARADRDGAEAG